MTTTMTPNMTPTTYDVNIDFDGAQEAWRANKTTLPNGCFAYKNVNVCIGHTKTGQQCRNKTAFEYCKIHLPKTVETNTSPTPLKKKRAPARRSEIARLKGYNKKQVRELKRLGLSV